jgi:hypothetical protein
LIQRRADYKYFQAFTRKVPNVETILEQTTPLVLDNHVRAVYLSMAESKHLQYRLALSGMPAVDILCWDHCKRSGEEKGATWDCNFVTKNGASVGCQSTNGTTIAEIVPTFKAIQERCNLMGTAVHFVVTDNHTCSKENLLKNWARVDRGLEWELDGNWEVIKGIFPHAKQPITDFFHITEAFDKPFPRRGWKYVYTNVHMGLWLCCRAFDKGDIELFKKKCDDGSFLVTYEFHGVVYTEKTPFEEWERSGAWLSFNSKKHTICRSHSNTLAVFYAKFIEFRAAISKAFLADDGNGALVCESGLAQPGTEGTTATIVSSAAWLKGHLDKVEIRAPQSLPHPKILKDLGLQEQSVVGVYQGMPEYGRLLHTCGVENKNNRSTGIVASTNTGIEMATAAAVEYEMYDYRRSHDRRSARPGTDRSTPSAPVNTDNWESWQLASAASAGIVEGYPKMPMPIPEAGPHVSDVFRKITTYLPTGAQSTIEGAGKMAMTYHPPVSKAERPSSEVRPSKAPTVMAAPVLLQKKRSAALAAFHKSEGGDGLELLEKGDVVLICGLIESGAQLNGQPATVISAAANGAWKIKCVKATGKEGLKTVARRNLQLRSYNLQLQREPASKEAEIPSRASTDREASRRATKAHKEQCNSTTKSMVPCTCGIAAGEPATKNTATTVL